MHTCLRTFCDHLMLLSKVVVCNISRGRDTRIGEREEEEERGGRREGEREEGVGTPKCLLYLKTGFFPSEVADVFRMLHCFLWLLFLSIYVNRVTSFVAAICFYLTPTKHRNTSAHCPSVCL